MSNRRLLTVAWTLTLLLLATVAFADVPQMINYQGRLTETDGTPVDGTELMKFKIYGSESGDDSLWWSGFVSVDIDNGFFDYQLGSLVPLPDDLFSTGTDRWLGVTVGTDAEISPRSRITSVGYSHHTLRSDSSGYATSIADGSVTESKIASYAVTQLKIADNAIHSSHIQDHSIIASDIGYEEITGDNIDDGTVGFGEISTSGVAEGEIMKLVGGVWTAATDEAGAGGDITGVTAGSGLGGGGMSGDVVVYVNSEAINSSHIATGGVGTSELASDAVITDKIMDEAVTSAKIADGAITTYKIFPEAVIMETIDDGAVNSSKIADGQVNTIDLANDAVTAIKLATDAVASGNIVDGSVSVADIGTDAVGSDEIINNSITAGDIETGGVKSDEIENNSIMDEDISGSANIATSKINGTAVNLSSLQTITGTKIFDGNAYFGDSTMRVNNDGIVIGTDEFVPTATYLLNAVRKYNSSAGRYGIKADFTNYGTGPLYALRSYARDTLGSAYGIRASAYSNDTRYGVYGYANDYGDDTSRSYGVYGQALDGTSAYGVYGTATSATINWAGYFSGNVNVTGTLSKGGGAFRIDHPLDPENRYLQHSFVESPDMMNVYNGNVTLDASGEAVIELPEYFGVLNKDFRYQLTAIGTPAPNLYVAERIENNHFMIAGGKPFMEVSWQVTGIRQDKWAEANRIQVEPDKPDNEKGLYVHPEALGYDRNKYINYEAEEAAKEYQEGGE